ATFSGTVTVQLYTETREIEKVTADPYTGKQWVTYTDTVSTSEQIHSESFDSTDVYVFDPSEFTLPESTELTRYQMRMYYTFDLEDGTCDKGSAYLYSNQFKERDPQTSPSSRPDVGIEVYNDTAYFGGGKYGLYRYTLEGETSVKAGEEVELTLYDNVSGTAVQDGYMLRILYRNGIMTTDLIPADEASFTFEEDMGPFVEVTGAYHCNGRFYRLPSYQITQNTSERTITVTHETDRESYSPGDTVTLTVRTEDHTGAPVSCTVNVSVVNEAIFVDRPQYTNIVYALLCDYASKYPAYSFSTYYDHELYYFTGGMGGGGGDDPRTNFADTACFETVTTDENGLAVITFTLPDSVTEYRITTHAAKGDMMYGATTSNFSAKMDFFLQSNPPRGQKHTDDFVAYATTVSEVSGRVDFTFTLKETGQTVETYADAGGAASANFGKLPTGTYTLRVDASLGEYSDAVEYPIEVEAGNMTNAYTQALTPDLPLTFSPSSYPVKVEIYTETAERYLKYFEFLQGLPATRLDTAISSVRADRLYNLLLERNESERYMRINEDFISGELLCIFADGAEDTVLSALCSYYAPELYRYSSSPWADTPESHLRSLMLSASVGRCTISELRCAERYITDEEHTAIIGLSYAFLGDYDNAKRMYGALPERSDIRGADALRAILATFVDRENASLIIDTLIGEESDEYYLGFALLSYLTHRISIMNEEHAVTLTVNGTSSVHSVNGLQIAELFLESQGTPDVTVSYTADDSVRVRLTYVDYEQIPDTADLYAWIEGDLTKYGTAYLMIDLSGYSGRKSLCIALPSSLRVNGSISSDGAYGYGKHEHVSITASKSFEGVVRVPLLVTQSGNYTVEPIRLTTEAGNRYYSNEITVDIG
ncbi:MAG: hypothetical protein IJ519_05700, partial [Clostridia bacterium]|nr:hypothetical protein [Clostridia bacterium]